VPRPIRQNSLTIVFLALFLVALVFQALTGWDVVNEEHDRHGEPTVSFLRYLTSSDFGSAVMENWQSEYLQFTLLILLTVWLLQRGSPESKPLDKTGRESDEEQLVGEHAREDSPRWAKVDGLRRKLYENSLVLVMGIIWLGSWFAQSLTGLNKYNAERLSHQQDTLSWPGYLGSSDFWETTLQNWQSEFLAVASMSILAVYLRQRGSPESKPVGASHEHTGTGS
jgi:membrane protein implicated in regulation of membrane protease activity